MNAQRVAGFCLIAAVCVSSAYSQEVQLYADFDNGSLGGWTQSENEIALSLTEHSGAGYFFFRIENVKDKTLKFVLSNPNPQLFTELSHPYMSYDQIHWSIINKRWIDAGGEDQTPRYLFEVDFAQPRAWVAATPPFSNDFVDQSLQQFLEHPHLRVETLCESPNESKPIKLLHVTDPAQANETKTVAFVLAREDALEPASSLTAWGMLTYLLSSDRFAAAIKRRTHFIILPLFDADGVAQAASGHPFSQMGAPIFWTEAWPETQVSFYEQRKLKEWLQTWKDDGKRVDYALRLHSDNWGRDAARREHARDQRREAQDQLFVNLIEQVYTPWRANSERVQPDTRFSKVVFDLFPDVVAGMIQTELLYDSTLINGLPLVKTTHDLMTEGELIVRSFGDLLGIQDSDPPPMLLSALAAPGSRRDRNSFAFQCVYRDMQGRAPEYVRVVIDETTIELAPADASQADYKKGVLFTGFAKMANRDNTHFFTASNGSTTTRSPHTGVWPGPYWLGGAKNER